MSNFKICTDCKKPFDAKHENALLCELCLINSKKVGEILANKVQMLISEYSPGDQKTIVELLRMYYQALKKIIRLESDEYEFYEPDEIHTLKARLDNAERELAKIHSKPVKHISNVIPFEKK